MNRLTFDRPHTRCLLRWGPALTLALAGAGLLGTAGAATPDELLAAYTKAAGKPASAERGQVFFTRKGAGEFGWSCATCHGDVPTRKGQNALTEKVIPPLAPAFNPTTFTDRNKTDGWFKNNCKDTLGRDCSAGERADVLAWLLTLKP